MSGDSQETPKVSKQKLILIGVLSVILVFVLLIQFSSTEGTPVASPANVTVAKRQVNRVSAGLKPVSRKKTPAPKTVMKKEHLVLEQVSAWPESTIAEATYSNPFQLPNSLKQAIEAKKLASKEAKQKPAAKPKEISTIDLDAMNAQKIREQNYQIANEIINELQTNGVDFVYNSHGSRFAKIGKHTIKEGDLFNGIRVKQIRTDGTVILKLELESQN